MIYSSVVITVLKLENLKAIHNHHYNIKFILLVVITVLKLENLKAIHNCNGRPCLRPEVVITVLKLENLKAIHNGRYYFPPSNWL